MRKIYFLFFVILGLNCFGWNVSTEPQPARALIEEYTGIHCPNCPDGHAIAARIVGLHPEEVYSVAIHAGYYANPGTGEPDFRTPIGEALLEYFEVGFFPSGVINRMEGAISRSLWGSKCRDVLASTSPVNLWTSSSFNPDNNEVTLDIEGYLTSSMSDPRLNVYLLQSEILGPQSGGQLGVEYPHRHVLRAALTKGNFGEEIDKKEKGDYFSKTLKYVIPAEIRGVATDPKNMTLLTFVSDGERNIVQVTESHISHPDFEQQLIVEAKSPLIPISRNYGFDFFEVMLHNFGGITLENAQFNVTINDKSQTHFWEGSIPGHSAQLVRIPLSGSWSSYVDDELNNYSIRLVKVNGEDVESPTMKGKYFEIGTYPNEMTLKIKTDLDAADNTYRILDTDGNVVKEFGPYPNGETEEYTESVSLEIDKIYCLEIADKWGDGICHPAGYVKLYDASGNQVGQYREINDYGMRQFFRTTDSSAVKSVGDEEVVCIDYFDINGRKIENPTQGIFIRRSVKVSGKTDYCKIIAK